MTDFEGSNTVLIQIRDAQLRFQEEQRHIANESLAMQKESLSLQREAVERQRAAVDAQMRHLRLYRRVLLVAGLLIVAVVAFLISLR